MEFLHRVDLDALSAGAGRLNQPLVDETSGVKACAVNCVKTPPGDGSPAGLHTHVVDQIFYILRGTMQLEIAGTEYQATPGTLVTFPAGVAHRNWNDGPEATLHLVINAPKPDPLEPFSRTVG